MGRQLSHHEKRDQLAPGGRPREAIIPPPLEELARFLDDCSKVDAPKPAIPNCWECPVKKDCLRLWDELCGKTMSKVNFANYAREFRQIRERKQQA